MFYTEYLFFLNEYSYERREGWQPPTKNEKTYLAKAQATAVLLCLCVVQKQQQSTILGGDPFSPAGDDVMAGIYSKTLQKISRVTDMYIVVPIFHNKKLTKI